MAISASNNSLGSDHVVDRAALVAALTGKRLLIVEEALKNHAGHWYEYDKAVYDINRDLGVATWIAAHRDVSADVRATLPAEPVCSHTNWDGLYAHPAAWRRYVGIAHHNARVYRTLNGFLSAHKPFDCIFVPTVIIHHIAGWRALVTRHLDRSFGRLVLFFRNNIGSYASDSRTPTFRRTSILWHYMLRSFAVHIKSGAVCLATDSDRLATEYELVSGIRPMVFPSPRIALPQKRVHSAAAARETFTFGCLGPARFEKGIDLLLEAIRRFLVANPIANVRFLIQWNQDVLCEDGSVYRPDPALEQDSRVLILRDQLDSAGYERLLEDIDCMVLPYRRESYFARISGVAVEAVTAGMPVIFTKDTWVEDLVHEVGAGIGVLSGDIDGLERAIETMLNQHVDICSRAQMRADLARNEHSAERFAVQLWGL
jgi:glycosyltransferase involved in cell wall biosynthesis